MNQTKTGLIFRHLIINLAGTAVLFSLSILAPLIRNQPITGSIVNSVLFTAAASCNLQSALLIAFFPSIVSFSVGFLPLIMAPMIPFIIVSNAVLILAFRSLWKRNYFLGVVAGSVLKFIFLSLMSYVTAALFPAGGQAKAMLLIMGWPQLFTALAGGLIAYVVLKGLKKV